MAGLLIATSAYGQCSQFIAAEWLLAGPGSPSSGNTGMGMPYNSGGSPAGTGWGNDGFFTVNEIGNGATSPQYRLDPAHPNASIPWRNIEFVATVYETEEPNDYRSSYGCAAELKNLSHKYLVGVRVKDNGDSTFTTTVDLIDNQTGVLTHPPLIHSHVLADTQINPHKYNVEMDGTGMLTLYVDDVQVATGLQAGLGAAAVDLAVCDLRGSWDPGGATEVFTNAHADIDRVAFSTQSIVSPPVPGPPVMKTVLGGGQGPAYTFAMSETLITNQQWAMFLNDAEANPGNARGANVHINGSGNVYMSAAGASEGLYTGIHYRTTGTGDLNYTAGSPVGSRFSPAAGRDKMPVQSVSWYGAMKYCNWLTIDTGLGESERAYAEGDTPASWVPVHMTPAEWLDGFDDAERLAWIDFEGYRLPMDHREATPSAYNEWHKAASYTGTTNTIYGFGRNTMTGADGNFFGSGDPWDGEWAPPSAPAGSYLSITPVGFYDGSLQLKGDWCWPDTDPNLTSFQTNPNENAWGIFDLSGTSWKWTADKAVGVQDPNLAVSIRGGSNISTTATCQVTVQGNIPPIRSNNPDNAQVSFHVVRVPGGGPFCGQPGTVYLDADTSGPGGQPDCYVDIYDLRDFLSRWLIVDNLVQFATLSEQWMLCTDPANASCM